MVVVPPETPETTPDELTAAMPDAADLQVPPVVVSVSVEVVPWQIVVVPVITFGNGFTITLTVSVLEQPNALVPVSV